MCDALGVSRQGYDQWKNRDDDGEADKVILDEIRLIMEEARYTYGLLRVTAALKDRGFRVNKKRVARIMKENNIRAKRVTKRKKTTDSKHTFPASEDRLKRQFNKTSAPNQVWVSDIIYITLLKTYSPNHP